MKQAVTLKADNKTVETLKKMISLKEEYRKTIVAKLKSDKK
ncbi:hypothetical protein OX283_002120 [Flavobacterium sp. SUN052]|nr:hypothetical protein [Flavobacterium sp. SUN052]MEC4003440.1 hypothetical protein [Flavobacterium sp. SUN052]